MAPKKVALFYIRRQVMAKASKLLQMWRRLENRPGGRWLFSRAVSWQAPYFSTIRPTVRLLQPGSCEVGMRKRRAVTNHIGSVHAIAMCNMAELAGGLMTDATVAPDYRWIPKAMSVEYRAIAKSDLIAHAYPIDRAAVLAPDTEYPVTVDVRDSASRIVLHAEITMWLSRPKPR
jgi:acyl-coenzyme A thioesterase PaaI-like protein